jgi:hypothetical protein
MQAVECPYCLETNHTSSPQIMAECAYCGARFAEVREEQQTLVILDNRIPGAWERAEELMEMWRERGELEREAIVDRRLSDEGASAGGFERRRFSAEAPALTVS